MYRILFISDDWTHKKPLKSALLEHGMAVTPLSCVEALQDDLTLPPQLDVVLIDLERCETDGAKLCHTLKHYPPLSDLPMVLLVPESHLGRLEFALGFEDYLTAPVSGARLAQRLKFLLWKLHRVEHKDGIAHQGLVIDAERYEVHLNGEPVDLTYKEFELLKFLATHPGKPFTREALLDKVWGYDYYGGTRTVDVHIRRLRSKLEVGGTIYIDTVRNVGYKFLSPPG